MSQILTKHHLYLDRYFPTADPLPQNPQVPVPDPNYEAGYSDFDQGYGDQDFYSETEIEGGMEEEAPDEAFGADPDAAQEDWEEAAPNAKQEALVEWLEENGEKLEKDFETVQEEYSNLQGGVETGEDSEKHAEKLKETEAALREIENDLERYARKEEQLSKSDGSQELGLEAPFSAEEMKEELAGVQEEVKKELDATEEAAEKKTAQEARTKEKEEEGRGLKDRFVDLLGYLNGEKGVRYFTGKVKGKHIFKYHEDVTEYAKSLLTAMADAAKSGDWSAVKSNFEAIPGDSVDNSLGLVGMILIKHDPELLDKVPSEILEGMSDAIRRGNEPGSNRIYSINQDGKYDEPKDNRRRKDMHHEDFSFIDAADRFRSQAETNRKREEIEKDLYGDEEAVDEVDSAEAPEEDYSESEVDEEVA